MELQQKVQALLDKAVENGTECGCQAALYINGELAVNAFAGWTDWTKTRKVDENTVFPIYSTGKAPSSTLLHRLVELGKLSYDTRISDIWPEFGCNGKEDMRVWHVLSYRCGLWDVPESTPEEQADFTLMTQKMAQASLSGAYGQEQKYHPKTYGWLTGGIACHATGRSDYFKLFQELVGEPAGMDRFFYGIPEGEKNFATPVKALDGSCASDWAVGFMSDPLNQHTCNPSTTTMSNALSVARHYSALDTNKVLSSSTLEHALSLNWRDKDDYIPLVKGRWALFGLGYVLSGPVDDLCRIFGHGGVGGSEGLLDRKLHYAIAFTRNCFAEPNLLLDFYDSVNFKNRDWPDPMEIPDQVKK